MSIQDIPNIKFITPQQRCFDSMLDFVTALASFGSYFQVYHDKPVSTFAPIMNGLKPMYPSIGISGNYKSVSFVPHEMFVDIILNGTRDTKIAYLEEPSIKTIEGVSTDAASMIEGFTASMFVRYYEDHLDEIIHVHSSDRTKWPAVLRFAVVVRNAMSHGGEINIMNPTASPVSHFGLQYSYADNGKKLLHNDLATADIFYLMLDMDAAF